jgi:hypothetical protein
MGLRNQINNPELKGEESRLDSLISRTKSLFSLKIFRTISFFGPKLGEVFNMRSTLS